MSLKKLGKCHVYCCVAFLLLLTRGCNPLGTEAVPSPDVSNVFSWWKVWAACQFRTWTLFTMKPCCCISCTVQFNITLQKYAKPVLKMMSSFEHCSDWIMPVFHEIKTTNLSLFPPNVLSMRCKSKENNSVHQYFATIKLKRWNVQFGACVFRSCLLWVASVRLWVTWQKPSSYSPQLVSTGTGERCSSFQRFDSQMQHERTYMPVCFHVMTLCFALCSGLCGRYGGLPAVFRA